MKTLDQQLVLGGYMKTRMTIADLGQNIVMCSIQK